MAFSTRPKKRSDCKDGPRPCPWLGCKYNILLDVTESGGIIFNFGRKVEKKSAGQKGRSRNIERRLPIIGARTSAKYTEIFKDSLEKLLEGIEDLGISNCLLDLVESGQTYTLEETGDMLNITRERIRQIESKAIKKLTYSSTKEMRDWEEHARNQT